VRQQSGQCITCDDHSLGQFHFGEIIADQTFDRRASTLFTAVLELPQIVVFVVPENGFKFMKIIRISIKSIKNKNSIKNNFTI